MSIQLDHTIVPSHDRAASGAMLAVPWSNAVTSPFTPVYVNDGFTLDFTGKLEPFPAYHFCFHVKLDKFDAILVRLHAMNIAYLSQPHGPHDMPINAENGHRRFY